MRLMEEDLTELADEAKEDDENDDCEDEKKGWYRDFIILAHFCKFGRHK